MLLSLFFVYISIRIIKKEHQILSDALNKFEDLYLTTLE